MKTTVDLPDDLVREAKLRALMQGRTLRDLIADYIRQGLDESAAPAADSPIQSSKVVIQSDGLPIIPGAADAPATRMTVQELLDLEQQAQEEEDVHHYARRPV